jgi:putative isomerase
MMREDPRGPGRPRDTVCGHAGEQRRGWTTGVACGTLNHPDRPFSGACKEESNRPASHPMNRRHFVRLLGSAVIVSRMRAEAIASAAASPGPLPIPDVWGRGQLLAFSGLDGPTDYAQGIVGRTLSEPAISIMLPAVMTIRLGEGRVLRTQLTCDSFDIVTDSGRTRGAFPDAHHLLVEGAHRVESVPREFQALRAGARLLLGVRPHFDPSHLQAELSGMIDSRQQWIRRQPAPDSLETGRRRTLAKAIAVMKGQVCSPEGMIRHRWTTPDRWPHRDLWLWDSVFHGIGWRHLDAALAREMIEAVLDGQQRDGRIPDELSPIEATPSTQPPLLAFGIQQVAGPRPDPAWLGGLYPRLARYLDWDFAHRNVDAGGLAEWAIDEGDPNCLCGESGMDNSPRFDAAAGLDAVDFSAYLSLECSVMADFARQLGRAGEAEAWAERHRKLNRLINERLWNEEAGFYFDYNPATRRQTGIFAVSGFLPLICGAAGGAKIDRLAAQFGNRATFSTAVPLPSAVPAAGMPAEKDMWRGPMWVNMNWLVAFGFERCGRKDLASRLRESTMREVERRYLERGSLFEFFDQEGSLPPDRLPRKGPVDPARPGHQAVHDYGWTATLYADLAFNAGNPR